MKKLILSLTLGFGLYISQAAVYVIVSTPANTFSPSTVNCNVGDTVAFGLTGTHTARQVSLSTWSVNGTTPLPGGFDFNAASTTAGTSFIVPATAGTIYFVCTAHAAMGMKGQVIVSPATGVAAQEEEFSIDIYPNPAIETLNLKVSSGAANTIATIEVINLLGTKVLDLGGKQVLQNGVRMIDISTLPRGVYFLSIVSDNKNKAIRFVKK